MTEMTFDSLAWPLNVSAQMQSAYQQHDPILDKLYAKAKAQQWDIEEYDWSHELNSANPLALPDATLLIAHTDFWNKLSDERQAEARCHFQGWSLSQILHGEQAALLCAAKLAQGERELSTRLCAAMQVADEARHVEAYARLVNEKVGIAYPMSQALKRLLEDTVSSKELDMTNLGMQILIEGIALSMFQTIVAYSRDPFVQALVSRIQRDEARHFAVGKVTLTRLYTQELGSAEIRLREEFLCEGISVLYEHLCADDIWEPLGHSRQYCGHLVRESKVADALRRSMFRRLIPSIRDIGLVGEPVMKLLRSLQLTDYLAWPSHETVS